MWFPNATKLYKGCPLSFKDLSPRWFIREMITHIVNPFEELLLDLNLCFKLLLCYPVVDISNELLVH